MTRRLAAAGGLGAAVLLAVTACGGTDDASTAAGTTVTAEAAPSASTSAAPDAAASTPAPAAALPAGTVPEVLDFQALALDGTEFSGASLAGTPTVVWFWAPWCSTCARGASAVTDAAEQLAGEVSFVGVGGLSGSTGDMQDFVDRTETGGFVQLADVEGDLFSRFGVVQQSTFAFVRTDGTVELVDAYGSEPDLVAEAQRRFDL